MKNDPQAVEEFKALFKIALDDNLSVAAFVENPQGGKPIIAALNVLYQGGKGQKIDFSQYIVRHVFHILNWTNDIFTYI